MDIASPNLMFGIVIPVKTGIERLSSNRGSTAHFGLGLGDPRDQEGNSQE